VINENNPPAGGGRTTGTARLIFKNPQKFIAAGQSVVLYRENGELLGGGIIT